MASTLAAPVTDSVRIAAVRVYVLPPDTVIEVCWLDPLKAPEPPNSCTNDVPLFGEIRSGTRPGLPASALSADQDCGTVADIDGWENFIWRSCEGFELIAATPMLPLVKLASVAVAVAVPPGPLTLQLIWLPVAAAVSV